MLQNNEIQTVKIQGSGYLLNGIMHVPKADGNSEYELIKQWLAEGNEPEPEFTDEEIAAKLAVETYNIAKAAKELALNSITVEVNGNVFDGRSKDQVNFMAAIQAAELLNKTEETWVLNDDTKELVTVDELKLALALAIQKVGEIVRG